MSVFTRRQLQRRLNSLAGVIGKRKLGRIVRDLDIQGNTSNQKRYVESLGVAWEVVIVSAFVSLGDMTYEKRISNGKKPDVFFHDGRVNLLADVVTVSDDEQHRKNPVEHFSSIIREMWRGAGLKGGISWRVDAINLEQKKTMPNTPGCWGPLHLSCRLHPISRRPIKRLALPPDEHLREYLYKKASSFFRQLHVFPGRPTGIHVDEEYKGGMRVRFSLSYNPQGGDLTGSYPSYTTITDMESHVLWGRLTDKSHQFRLAEEQIPRVVFVCDGGCDALHHRVTGGNYACDELISHFWRRPVWSEDDGWSWVVEKGISAIVLLPIASINPSFGCPNRRDFVVKPELYLNPHSCVPLDEHAIRLLGKVASNLPVAVESPANVIRAIRIGQVPSRHLGYFTMKADHIIEMSGVELLRILAGDLSLEEFCTDYSFSSNPFKDALKRCQLIKSVKVEPITDRDDDRVIIEFGPHDPALGAFLVPQCR
jgi:hypothetical protein